MRHIDHNLLIPNRFREKYQKNPPLRICKTPYEDIEKEKFRNRFPLKTLLKQDPGSYVVSFLPTDDLLNHTFCHVKVSYLMFCDKNYRGSDSQLKQQ